MCKPNRVDPGLLKTCLSDDEVLDPETGQGYYLLVLDQLLDRKILEKSASRGEGIGAAHGAAHDKKVTSSLALSVL